MGLAVSLVITAVGLILALAVHPTGTHSVNVNTVGWILFIVGLIGFIVDLLLWSEMGPGYMRRTYATNTTGYPARRSVRGPRRTIVEEEDVAPGPPPPGY